MVARFGAWPPKSSPEIGRIRRVADVLLDYLVPEVDPDVALVWFPEPDTSQHAAGVGRRPAVEALTAADAELGRVLGELSARGVDPDVLVVSDHGYSTIARRIQLEEVVREAGFPAGEGPGGVTVAANGGAALFYVRDSEPRALERFARWLVAQPWAGALVAGRAEGAALGCFRPIAWGWRGLGPPTSPCPSAGIRWRRAAPPARPTAAKGAPGLGTHGSGSPQELRCVLVASGPSFRPGIVSELPSGNVDVAPTVLAAPRGRRPTSPFDGRPLTEALAGAAEPAPRAPPPRHHEAQLSVRRL